MDGWIWGIDEWMDGLVDGSTNDGWKDGGMDARRDGSMDGRTDGWMNESKHSGTVRMRSHGRCPFPGGDSCRLWRSPRTGPLPPPAPRPAGVSTRPPRWAGVHDSDSSAAAPLDVHPINYPGHPVVRSLSAGAQKTLCHRECPWGRGVVSCCHQTFPARWRHLHGCYSNETTRAIPRWYHQHFWKEIATFSD